VNVARKSGLRDLKAAATQLAAQLVLIGDQGVADKFPNRIVPLKLHRRPMEPWLEHPEQRESAARSAAAALV
jgi:hypothetical protein